MNLLIVFVSNLKKNPVSFTLFYDIEFEWLKYSQTAYLFTVIFFERMIPLLFFMCTM